MKIAVISDIHGNMDALNSVIEDIKSQDCEEIYALGDYVMAGPEPDIVIDWFIKKSSGKHFTLIQGNTDFMIANYSDELYETLKSKAPVMAEALKSDSKKLNPYQKIFLRNLPIQLQTEVEGVKFLLCHGSPRKNNEDIMPDTPIKQVEEMLKNVEASVVFCGHTHIPCGFQTSTKQTVINAGSVGRPFTEGRPEACWLKLTVENGKCVFEHRFVKYDNQKAAETLAKRSFKGSEKLAATLLNPKERHF